MIRSTDFMLRLIEACGIQHQRVKKIIIEAGVSNAPPTLWFQCLMADEQADQVADLLREARPPAVELGELAYDQRDGVTGTSRYRLRVNWPDHSIVLPRGFPTEDDAARTAETILKTTANGVRTVDVLLADVRLATVGPLSP